MSFFLTNIKAAMSSSIKHSEIFDFANIIEYSENGIISKKLIQKPEGSITLFSFDKGQELSEHTAPFDALVQIMEGQAEIIIDKKEHKLSAGESIIMPANIPHAVKADEKFKMLLTMIKEKN